MSSLLALVVALIGATVLALPLVLGWPLDVVGPLVAPLGGGLALAGLVAGLWAWRARRGRDPPIGLARAAVIVAVGGVLSAAVIEQALVRHDRRAREQRAIPGARPAGAAPGAPATDDSQFDRSLQDNLTR